MLLRPGSLTRFGLLRTGGGGHELLGGAHRQPLIHDLLSNGLNLSLVTQRQEGAGMASRENPGGNATLHQGGQLQQANRVRNLGAGTTDALGELLLSSVELLHELLVCRCLFNGVQLTAVQVFQQGVT